VTALVLADLLEREDAETLFAPWGEAVGDPSLPEYSDEDEDEDAEEDAEEDEDADEDEDD
jgi:hypothetical protein